MIKACLASAFSVVFRSLLCKKRSLIKFSSADYLCFALLATASRGLAYAKFYLHNPKNHLTILRLIVLRSNLKSNLAKFVNLTSNLTHRDPYLDGVKFNSTSNLKICGATAPNLNLHAVQQPLTCSGVGEGVGEEGATLRK